MGTLVHTCLGSSYLIAHVLHCPPPSPRTQFIIGPAVINKHTGRPPSFLFLAVNEGHLDVKELLEVGGRCDVTV
jgi:hypothetical protein